MIIYDFTSREECNNVSDLLKVLKRRSKGNSNEFELRMENEYPYLTILVKDEFACVHFFIDEDDCGHYAYTDNNEVNDEYIIFNMGSENSETEISRDLVISVELANDIAVDFYEQQKMSDKVKWFEL